MPSTAIAYVQLLAGALLLSTGSVAIKASGLSAPALAGWRALVIVAFLALAVRPARACYDRRLLPAALAHGVTTLLFMWGNKLTTAATAIFLQYTAPIYLLLLGPLVLKEPVARRDFAYVGLLLLGMVLLLLHPPAARASAPDPLLGGIIAALCGVTWACTTLTMRGLARDPVAGFQRTIASIIVANLVLAFALLPAYGLTDGLPAARDLGIAAYMGVFQLGLSFILITLGLRRVNALDGALILLIEPVVNPLWVWLVHDEVPGVWGFAGGALILLGTGSRIIANARRAQA
jgi:DME family drug/metabolite transporter